MSPRTLGVRSRLSVLPFAIALLPVLASPAYAVHPTVKEWSPPSGSDNPALRHDLPMTFRTTADISWVRVHPPGQSPCAIEDAGGEGSGKTIEEVWCFEGAGGDSTWPASPPRAWDHWSKFDPPGTQLSKWHISQMNPNAST